MAQWLRLIGLYLPVGTVYAECHLDEVYESQI